MQNRDILSIFFNMDMLCVFIGIASSYILFLIKKQKEITLNYPKFAEFETAVVDEPSVFEPLKFYYIRNREGR